MPSGIPTTAPIATAMVDCQEVAAASCALVKPSAFNSARSRFRRLTEATSVRPRVVTMPAARAALSKVGVASKEPRLMISAGRCMPTTAPPFDSPPRRLGNFD